MRLDSNVYVVVEKESKDIVLMGGSLIAILRMLKMEDKREEMLEEIGSGYDVKIGKKEVTFKRVKLGKVNRTYKEVMGFDMVG